MTISQSLDYIRKEALNLVAAVEKVSADLEDASSWDDPVLRQVRVEMLVTQINSRVTLVSERVVDLHKTIVEGGR